MRDAARKGALSRPEEVPSCIQRMFSADFYRFNSIISIGPRYTWGLIDASRCLSRPPVVTLI